MLGVRFQRSAAIGELICCMVVRVGMKDEDDKYLIAPSKLPGRKPKPCPISCRKRSPSTSRSSATSKMTYECNIHI